MTFTVCCVYLLCSILEESGVHLQYNVHDTKWRRKSLPAQVAFLQLPSLSDQNKLLGKGWKIPKRMKVLKSTQAELDWSINHQLTDCRTEYTVWLNGLPYGVTEKEIRAFLQPLQPVDVRLFGQGVALVDFVTRSDAGKASSKDGKYIGTRYVRVINLTLSCPDEDDENFKWPAPLI